MSKGNKSQKPITDIMKNFAYSCVPKVKTETKPFINKLEQIRIKNENAKTRI